MLPLDMSESEHCTINMPTHAKYSQKKKKTQEICDKTSNPNGCDSQPGCPLFYHLILSH